MNSAWCLSPHLHSVGCFITSSGERWDDVILVTGNTVACEQAFGEEKVDYTETTL